MTERGPEWIIPMEAVRALATGQGSADIVRLSLAHALFRPHATCRLVDDRFIAICAFEEPKYPGRVQQLPVSLTAVPQENRL